MSQIQTIKRSSKKVPKKGKKTSLANTHWKSHYLYSYENTGILHHCLSKFDFIWLGLLSRICWSSLDNDNLKKKNISILAEYLNSSHSYLFKAVHISFWIPKWQAISTEGSSYLIGRSRYNHLQSFSMIRHWSFRSR